MDDEVDASASGKVVLSAPETLEPSEEAVGVALNCAAMSALVVDAFSPEGDDPYALMRLLEAQCEAVHSGNLRGIESMLTSQAFSLNAIFNDMALRAGRYAVGESLHAAEACLRLALKAQGQCSATLSALAAIKRPVIFANQANIANTMQVNNGSQPPAKAPDQKNQPIKLLGDRDGTRLDSRTTGLTGGNDPALATVGVVDWTPDSDRQGARGH
jgi:hypothetical protein